MFKLTAEDTKTSAKCGLLQTAHGPIETPVFMPVATKGAVRFIDSKELADIATQCFISNSLLLYQKPGIDIISKAGGLHGFCGWKKGIFTDSGGFQTLNQFFRGKPTDEGMSFKSPYSGKFELITPEKSMEIQAKLGADIIMCLDDVPMADDDKKIISEKTRRTHLWAERCKNHHDTIKKEYGREKQLLFGIAQGGMDKVQRKKSAKFITGIDFDGYAIGGLAIGEKLNTMHDMLKVAVDVLPIEKPRYLMGVGSPVEILDCISMGVDFFDSTFPTQNGRHGTLFTWDGKLKITKSEYKDDINPVDTECGCFVCKNYPRAFIHHLLKLDTATGKKLASYHNLYFMQDLIKKAKISIKEGDFERFKKDFSEIYQKKY